MTVRVNNETDMDLKTESRITEVLKRIDFVSFSGLLIVAFDAKEQTNGTSSIVCFARISFALHWRPMLLQNSLFHFFCK